MSEHDRLAERLLPLFRTEIRGLLEEHNAPALDALDQLARLLERARARKEHLDFGFVGESQVGKSTLINALVGEVTLPSSGIGPLTAQATEVTYASHNSIWVRYHARKKLNQLVFAMERYLIARGEPITPTSGTEDPTEDDESPDLAEASEPGTRSKKGEYFLEQARLMLTGGDGELSSAALIAGLRAVLGHSPRGDSEGELAPHAERIAMLRARCNTTEVLTADQLGSARAFAAELKLRAAGALAPLIAELKVSLNIPFLQYATLVDLPGIGVVNDAAADVAEEFVRTRGDALIVVTRNNGLPQTVAQLLERTGVITKLLFGGTDDAQIHVLIAVTHVDSVAKERYAEAITLARESGAPRPDRHAVFSALAEEMRETIRSQVEAALRSSPSFEDLPPDKKARRDDIVTRLCGGLDVLIVAANDFLYLSAGHDDLAFLKESDSTGIPAFRARIQQISSHLASRRHDAIRTSANDLCDGLEDHLAAIAQLYEEGGGRANAEWERFRDELGSTLTPLREEMKAHHGEIIATLRSTVPTKIELLCKNAETLATQRLRRLRKRGEQEVHVRSLEAALRRGGVWDRRAINYPDAITRAFVDSVASDWEPMIIDGIRETMRSLAERDVSLVEQLCASAGQFDERIVGDAHIDMQKKLLRQHARACISWTRERLEQFRDDVQQKLFSEVSQPIEKAATQAIKAGQHQGAGAKIRILDAFEEGGTKAIARAQERALQVLRSYYGQLFGELSKEYLEAHHDPLQAAFEALTSDELVRARRSDSQRRRRVLEQVATHRSALTELRRAQP